MRRKILLVVLLALVAMVCCFAESLTVEVTITRDTTDWKKWTARLLTTLPDNPASGVEYVIRVRIENANGQADWINLSNSRKTYSSTAGKTNPVYLKVYLGYLKTGSTTRVSEMETADLENTGTKTYTFTLDYEPYSANPQTKGNVWYESNFDVFDLGTGFAIPQLQDSVPTSVPPTSYLSKVVSSGNSHPTKVTIETSGRFVSLSHPESYLDFSVALLPKYSTSASSSVSYCYDAGTSTALSPTEYAKNTENALNKLEFIIPRTDAASSPVGSGSANISEMDCYLLICTQTPDEAILRHMTETDDYQATITLKFECAASGCTLNHQDYEQTIIVRGYYGADTVEDLDWVYLSVSPVAGVGNMNLTSIFNNTPKSTRIADLRVLSASRTEYPDASTSGGYPWNEHLFVFLSSSSQYDDSSAGLFRLKNTASQLMEPIDFVIDVLNASDGSLNKTYDGTDYWTGTGDTSFCIDLGNLISTTSSKKEFSAVDWTGYADFRITEEDLEGMAGRYETYVYYHIIYAD